MKFMGKNEHFAPEVLAAGQLSDGSPEVPRAPEVQQLLKPHETLALLVEDAERGPFEEAN